MRSILLAIIVIGSFALMSQRRSAMDVSDRHAINNIIFRDTIIDSTSVIGETNQKNMLKPKPVKFWDYVRYDSLSGHPKVVFNKYVRVVDQWYLYFTDTTIFDPAIWDTVGTNSYFDTIYQFDDQDYYIRGIRNEIKTIDSTQAIRAENDLLWEYVE